MGFNFRSYSPSLVFFSDNQTPKKTGGDACSVNGDTVDVWNDDSGNNNHVTYQAGGSSRATWNTNIFNGLPALFFNGNTTNCVYKTANQLTYGPFTMFAVKKATGTGILFERGPSFTANAGEVLNNNSIALGLKRGSTLSGLTFPSNSWATDNATYLVSTAFNGHQSSSHVWLNGALQSLAPWVAADAGTGSVTDYGYVGNRTGGGQGFIGYLACLLVFPTYLTITQWLNVYMALAQKYAISGGPSLYVVNRG